MPDTTPARPEPFTLAVDQTQTLLALLDPDGRLTFANARALAMIAAGAAVVGEPFWETPWWRHDAVGRTQLRLAIAEAALTGARGTPFNALLATSSGERCHIDFTVTPLREDDGPVVALLVEGHDVTARWRAEQALAEAQRRTELILATAAEGIVGVDAQGVITFVNAAVAAQLERPVESTVGRPLGEVLCGDAPEEAGDECPTMTAIGIGVPCEGEDTYRRADGSTFRVEFSARPLVVDGARAGAVLSFRDVTERKAVEAQLLALSMHDELTGVHNRRGFVMLAEQELALARRAGVPVVLSYVDVDQFKHINDAYGHSAGDAALRHLADALRRTLRESDVIGRVGGDEFVVLAAATGDVGPPEAMAQAWRARLDRALAVHPGRSAYGDAPLSVSAGWVVGAPGDERSLEALMAEADAALYACKRARLVRGAAPST